MADIKDILIEEFGNALGTTAGTLLDVIKRMTADEVVALYELVRAKKVRAAKQAVRAKLTNEEAADAVFGQGILFGELADANLERKEAVDAIALGAITIALKALLGGFVPFF